MGFDSEPSTAAFQQEVRLGYRWTNGETLRYRKIQQTTTIFGLPGGTDDMSVDQTTAQVFRFLVEAIAADGTTTLQQVIESVRLEMSSPAEKTTYDSAVADTGVNTADPAMTSVLAALISEPLTVVQSPAGAVQKVEGASGLVEKMFKNPPQDPGAAATQNTLKGMFNDDMLNVIGHEFPEFPDRPLKPGDTWDNEITTTMPMFGAFTTSIAATLKAVEGSASDHVARITTQLTVKPDPPAPDAANPIGSIVQLGESTGEGEILFDVVRGRLLRSITRTTTPVTMPGADADGTPISTKANVKGTLTVELIQQ